jgi:RNA 3'-terminal phosphate cyclase (ATP)
MLEIDGSLHSGSGTLLRYAVALATLVGEPLHMVRIRAKREKPGLRPQHLEAIRACATLSEGELTGAEVGSQEIFYRPGRSLPAGGDFEWDIGTAGSATMLAFTLIPLALYGRGPLRFILRGGLFQDLAPSALHMAEILVPLLKRMGAEIRLEIQRPGYVPKGQGELFLQVNPLSQSLKPLGLTQPGRVKEIWGVSLASHLRKEGVAQRMAARCRELLEKRGLPLKIEILEDEKAIQKGAALFLMARTEPETFIGADRAGRPGRRSEAIAEFVVRSLLEDLNSGATTDRHLADQLILFAALAQGTTEYLIPALSDHIPSNLFLVERILGAKWEMDGKRIRIEGIGFRRP